MKTVYSEERIQELMKILEGSREEIMQMLEDDENDFIGDEGEEMDKKAKTVEKGEKRGRKPRQKGEGVAGVALQKRAKKENATKATIISTILEAIKDIEGIAEIDNPNPEKTILFKLGDNTFEIDLKQKRKPKEGQ